MAEQDTAAKTDNRPADRVKAPALQARFKELSAKKAEVLKTLEPARTTYDKLINAPELLAARKAIKEGNKLLAPIDEELAVLARGLGAKGLKLDPGVYTKE